VARAIQFRVSDAMYARIEEEAHAVGASVARFAREACVGRAAVWAYRRGFMWADADAWDHVIDAVEEMDQHDIKLRAQLARQARLAKKARER
jgi:uncharacterized protein (DUF1778 family)